MKLLGLWLIVAFNLPVLAQGSHKTIEVGGVICSQVFVPESYLPGGEEIPSVGMWAALTQTITYEQIQLMAQVTGDFNAIHVDREYARSLGHRDVVAHGILVAGLISNVAGNYLPGPGTVLTKQISTDNRYPTFPGDTLTARVEVKSVNHRRRLVNLFAEVKNQRGECVLRGHVKVVYKPSSNIETHSK